MRTPGWPSTPKVDSLFDPDIEALAAIATASVATDFLSVAKEAFARRYQEASPEEALRSAACSSGATSE